MNRIFSTNWNGIKLYFVANNVCAIRPDKVDSQTIIYVVGSDDPFISSEDVATVLGKLTKCLG